MIEITLRDLKRHQNSFEVTVTKFVLLKIHQNSTKLDLKEFNNLFVHKFSFKIPQLRNLTKIITFEHFFFQFKQKTFSSTFHYPSPLMRTSTSVTLQFHQTNYDIYRLTQLLNSNKNHLTYKLNYLRIITRTDALLSS